MLTATRYGDAAAFLDAAADLFVADELFTTLPSGVLNRLKRTPDLYGDPAGHYFVLVTTRQQQLDSTAGTRYTLHTHCNLGHKACDPNLEVELQAQRQLGVGRYALSYHLASSATPEEISEAIVLLIRHLDDSGQARAVKEVEGLTQYAEEMAAELEIITATDAHVELLADWNQTFGTRIRGVAPGPEESRKMAVSWVDGRDGSKAYLLSAEVDGKREMVSVCVTNRQTPNTRTISMVYTPIEFGGRGYATRLVASITQRILSEKRYSCLFADVDNPHSNYVYHKVGYRKHSCWDNYAITAEQP